jgi:hypothetical protein
MENETNDANLLKSKHILYVRTGTTEVLLGTPSQHNTASLAALDKSPNHFQISYKQKANGALESIPPEKNLPRQEGCQ